MSGKNILYEGEIKLEKKHCTSEYGKIYEYNKNTYYRRKWDTESDIKWTIYDNKTIIIKGNGVIPDYQSFDNPEENAWFYPSPWYYYRDCYNNIIIENGITSIGDYSFDKSKFATSVIIPNSVTNIGNHSFRDCHNLQSIIIGNSVETIESYAFCKCLNLTYIIIPESVKYIEYSAFYLCKSLNEIINYATEPQKLGEKVFRGMDKTKCVLKVPYKSIEKYKNSEGWKEFENIKPIKFNCVKSFITWVKKLITSKLVL